MNGAYGRGSVLLGKYRVEDVLGSGGMGVVLRVTHLQLGEDLALKILLPELAATPDMLPRFLREAQAVVRLKGEHVARVSDVGTLPDGAPYMLMEYLRGVDLAGKLQQQRVLPPGEAVDYVLQACEALAEAHALQIVHRDIKPANLFLTKRPDGTPLIKVLDFGISKAPITAGALTNTGTVMGTPGYMSPEQMKATREVDARSDIWSLGVVLYECLSGRPPFIASSFSAMVLLAANERPSALPSSIPRGLQAAVFRCLEKDREQRFSSIAKFAAALAPFARDQRAAQLIVERATSMHTRPKPASEPVVHAKPREDQTTISLRGGKAQTTSRGRYVVAGLGAALGAFVVVLAAIASRSSEASQNATAVHASTKPVAGHMTTPDSTPPSQAPELKQPSAAPELKPPDSAPAQKPPHAAPELKPPDSVPELKQPSAAPELDPPAIPERKLPSPAPRRKPTSPAPPSDPPKIEKPARPAGPPEQAPKPREEPGPPQPTTNGAPPPPPPHPAPPGPAQNSSCAGVNVDAMLNRARQAHDAGQLEAASQIAVEAVTCNRSSRTYNFAVHYACDAKKAALAKALFSQLSAQQRTAAKQRCQRNGITLVP